MIDRAALEKVAARHLAGISYVALTAREPGRSTIGFHTEWTAKKPG